MKKIIILVSVLLLIITLIFGGYLYKFYNMEKPDNTVLNESLKERIEKNSSWVFLSQEDLNGYLNESYTKNVETIINSLEEAIPVIIETQNDKFTKDETSAYVVASSFNSSNKVYLYYYNRDTSSYEKTLVSLESLLEDATAAYIYDETEELK